MLLRPSVRRVRRCAMSGIGHQNMAAIQVGNLLFSPQPLGAEIMPINTRGYIYERIHGHPLADNRGRVLQHRRVWFEHNGAIPLGAIVHHKNENKLDNSIDNLELHLSRSEHMKEHYPNGFWSKAWNKGTTEYQEVQCECCGNSFVRMAKEVRKTIKRGQRIVCGALCRTKLPRRARGE